jgi:transcriptional regulator with XRE-family HTH domain
MQTSEERKAFSARLKAALKRAEKPVRGSTELALQFNLRHVGEPVTPQACQLWLSGKGMPTPEKIQTLADWLGVSSHWLRFGSPEDLPSRPSGRQTKTGRKVVEADQVTEEERDFLKSFRKLSPDQRKLIADLVLQLAIPKD